MKRHLISLIASAAILASATSLKARGINQREHHQLQRIHQGVRSGELTRRETHRLLGQQAHILIKEHRFRSDGVLSPRERIRLQYDLNRASRAIYRQKHDRQRR